MALAHESVQKTANAQAADSDPGSAARASSTPCSSANRSTIRSVLRLTRKPTVSPATAATMSPIQEKRLSHVSAITPR